MALALGKLKTQSSAHASVISPDKAIAKYLYGLLFYKVVALTHHDLVSRLLTFALSLEHRLVQREMITNSLVDTKLRGTSAPKI